MISSTNVMARESKLRRMWGTCRLAPQKHSEENIGSRKGYGSCALPWYVTNFFVLMIGFNLVENSPKKTERKSLESQAQTLKIGVCQHVVYIVTKLTKI